MFMLMFGQALTAVLNQSSEFKGRLDFGHELCESYHV
uniref:Uncharacterized protein n=1 Tax=Arundo donax TaxID=35708 RepID=A0A0A8YW07_ARUDO